MENTPSTTAIPTIHIYIRDFNGVPTECVNARELHTAMKVGRDFSNWIKDRINKYRFESEVDYVLISRSPVLASGPDLCSPKRASKNEEGFAPQNGGAKKTSDSRGGHNAVDYYVTLDMAKELAMLERSELGQQARRYFINAEKAGRADRAELEQLRQQLEELKADPGLEPLTKAEAAQLRSMVAGIAMREKHDLQSLAFRRIYSRLRDRFAVKSYSLIPRFRFMEAVAYLQDINELFEPEPGLRTLPDPEPEIVVEPEPEYTPEPEPEAEALEQEPEPQLPAEWVGADRLNQQMQECWRIANLMPVALERLCDDNPSEELWSLLWLAQTQQTATGAALDTASRL